MSLPALFDSLPDDGDSLSSGLTGGYAVLSIRSSRFRLKYQGSEKIVMGPDGQTPAGFIDVVLVKASPALAKVYYESGYADGSDDAPDCYSNDGVKPDMASTKPQSATCASCKWNVIGSRITPNGSKVKACADSRRTAIVPAQDMKNVDYGGPMLLRVPASSLGNLADYGRALKQRGFKPSAVVTRIAFDAEASFPKLTFAPARAVSNDEIGTVLEHHANAKIAMICSEGHGGNVAPPPAMAIAPPQVAQIAPVPAVVVMPAPVAAPAPVPVQAPADPFAVLGGAPAVAAPPPPPPAPRPPADPFAVLGALATPAQPVAPQPVSTSPVPTAATGTALEQDIKSLLAKLDSQ